MPMDKDKEGYDNPQDQPFEPKLLFQNDDEVCGMRIKRELNMPENYISNRETYIGVKEISVNTVIENSIAVTYMRQTYQYPKIDEKGTPLAPAEVSFKFPKDPTSTVAKMTLTIDDKFTDCTVMEKKAA